MLLEEKDQGVSSVVWVHENRKWTPEGVEKGEKMRDLTQVGRGGGGKIIAGYGTYTCRR